MIFLIHLCVAGRMCHIQENLSADESGMRLIVLEWNEDFESDIHGLWLWHGSMEVVEQSVICISIPIHSA